jgi:pyruvate kinase
MVFSLGIAVARGKLVVEINAEEALLMLFL